MACAAGTITSDTAPAANSSSGSPATSAAPRNPAAPRARAARCDGEKEAGDDQHALEGDAFPDVAVDVVRDLVREHHLDLVVGKLREHRVGDEDPARAAEAGERGVAFLVFSPRPHS